MLRCNLPACAFSYFIRAVLSLWISILYYGSGLHRTETYPHRTSVTPDTHGLPSNDGQQLEKCEQHDNTRPLAKTKAFLIARKYFV